MTRWYNRLCEAQDMRGVDPDDRPVLDREAWMADARARRQSLIDYWLERGRPDYAESLKR